MTCVTSRGIDRNTENGHHARAYVAHVPPACLPPSTPVSLDDQTMVQMATYNSSFAFRAILGLRSFTSNATHTQPDPTRSDPTRGPGLGPAGSRPTTAAAAAAARVYHKQREQLAVRLVPHLGPQPPGRLRPSFRVGPRGPGHPRTTPPWPRPPRQQHRQPQLQQQRQQQAHDDADGDEQQPAQARGLPPPGVGRGADHVRLLEPHRGRVGEGGGGRTAWWRWIGFGSRRGRRRRRRRRRGGEESGGEGPGEWHLRRGWLVSGVVRCEYAGGSRDVRLGLNGGGGRGAQLDV